MIGTDRAIREALIFLVQGCRVDPVRAAERRTLSIRKSSLAFLLRLAGDGSILEGGEKRIFKRLLTAPHDSDMLGGLRKTGSLLFDN